MNKSVVVVGAGMAGLSVALEAVKRGWKVTVVEKAPVTGGLTRSFTVNDCILDVGVHILHLRDKEVEAAAREVVPADQWIKIKRNGKLYLQGKYVDWPLKPSSAFQMPKKLAALIVTDQFFSKPPKPTPSESNFQSELLSLYGRNLYYALFHPLTKRFLQTEPAMVHSDWAFSSIRSATKIEDSAFNASYQYLPENTGDEAKKDFNIFKFVKNQFLLKQEDDPFYYFKDGYGVLPDSYRKRIEELGGTVLTSTTVDKMEVTDGQVRKVTLSNGTQLDTDAVVWTGNLENLCEGLNLPKPGLTHLHSKFAYVFLKKPKLKHQVCYYADEDISFVRGTILSNHSKSIIKNPKVQDVICLEYTFPEPGQLFEDSTALWKRAIEDMKKTRLIRSQDDVLATHELNVPYSYPVLTFDYRVKLAEVRRNLAPFTNVFTSGRQAAFGYENADVIIKDSLHHPLFADA